VTRFALPALIVALALVDGVIHLSLDVFFFHGRFFGDILAILFFLNFTGYVVLVGGFLLSARSSPTWRRIVDLAMLVYATATVLAWLGSGDPNLLGLGFVAKADEVTLILALIVHVSTLRGEQPAHSAPVLQ
jgi:hypothetical protein